MNMIWPLIVLHLKEQVNATRTLCLCWKRRVTTHTFYLMFSSSHSRNQLYSAYYLLIIWHHFWFSKFLFDFVASGASITVQSLQKLTFMFEQNTKRYTRKSFCFHQILSLYPQKMSEKRLTYNVILMHQWEMNF